MIFGLSSNEKWKKNPQILVLRLFPSRDYSNKDKWFFSRFYISFSKFTFGIQKKYQAKAKYNQKFRNWVSDAFVYDTYIKPAFVIFVDENLDKQRFFRSLSEYSR